MTEPYESGSFRDRNARVFTRDGSVFRGLSQQASIEGDALAETRFFGRFSADGRLVATDNAARGYVALLFALGLLLWAQGNLWVGDYGVVDGTEIDFSRLESRVPYEVGASALILTAALLFRRQFNALAPSASAIFLALQGVAIMVSSLGTAGEGAARWQEPAAGLFEFSAQQNVIHVILDEFQSDVLTERARIYDSSLIVVSSDHGTALDPKGFSRQSDGLPLRRGPSTAILSHIAGTAKAIMMIKPPGAAGPLIVSQAPTMQSDLPATVFDVLSLSHGFSGQPMLQRDPDEQRSRTYSMYDVSQGFPEGYLKRLDLLTIDGRLLDAGLWNFSRSIMPPGAD